MTSRPVHASALVLVAALAAACSTDTGDPPSANRSTTATSTASTQPATTRSPTVGPLALVTHPSRPAIDISSEVAAEVVAGRVDDWSELGASPGPLRLRSTAAASDQSSDVVTDAAEVLAAISRDSTVIGAVPASAVTPRVRVVSVDGVHPLRDPASYPLTTPDDAAPAVTTATVVGDVMLARRVGARMAAAGDFAAALRPTAARLASADLTVGNLESTLSRLGRPRQGGDSFGADPRVRRGLRLAGFD